MITAKEARENAIKQIESILKEDKALALKAKAIDELLYEASSKGQTHYRLNVDSDVLLALLLLKGFKIMSTEEKGAYLNRYTVSWV